MRSITTEEIAVLSKYILKISGIYLTKSKGYLFESRLKEMGTKLEVKSYDELLDRIKKDHTRKLEKKLIDAISTNETYFFRDNIPFDLLRSKIIPDLVKRKRRYLTGTLPIRIWSAASSTGQEIYSIAITLLEMLPERAGYDISILGTDISGDAIAKASKGKYNRFEIKRGLPVQLRDKYFNPSGNSWQIKENIRALTKFKKLNLMRPFPPDFGPFDVIFCRNVAIYFQNHDRQKLFKKISQVLSVGGALIVGGSENLSRLAPDFISQQYPKGVIYILKKDSTPAKSADHPGPHTRYPKSGKTQSKTADSNEVNQSSSQPGNKKTMGKSMVDKNIMQKLTTENAPVEKGEPQLAATSGIKTSFSKTSLIKGKEKQKKSLLENLQKTRTTNSATNSQKDSQLKTSLLHKIHSQNKAEN